MTDSRVATAKRTSACAHPSNSREERDTVVQAELFRWQDALSQLAALRAKRGAARRAEPEAIEYNCELAACALSALAARAEQEENPAAVVGALDEWVEKVRTSAMSETLR